MWHAGWVKTARAPARKDGEKTREALLDAAVRCFRKKGLLQTRLADVCKVARASPSSFYHFFDDLPALQTALLLRIFDRLFQQLTEETTKTTTAQDAVMTLVSAHLDWVFSHESEAFTMYQLTSIELGPQTQQAVAQHKVGLYAPLVAHLTPFIARGELPAWPPLLFDVVVLGAAHESCRRYLSGAPLEKAWMTTTLPALAWSCVSSLGSPKQTPST